MSNSNRNLCMIPGSFNPLYNLGPVEVHEEVLEKLSIPALSHIDPQFIKIFSNCLKMFRELMLSKNPKTLPVILSGSGTLGWDVVASNLIEPSDRVLVVSTGLFGDRFAKCLKSYAANVDEIVSNPGDIVPLNIIDEYLSKEKYKLLTLTHVDTSTGVFMDIEKITGFVRDKYPNVLICVDAVCSALCEDIKFDEYRIDVVLTASQKGIGIPPGLSLLLFSERAIEVRKNRKTHVFGYYTDLDNWIKIMDSYENNLPSYFGTPNVQLICALETSLKIFKNYGIQKLMQEHEESSIWFRKEIKNLGLEIVPIKPEFASRSMTAIYYPQNIEFGEFLSKVSKEGVTLAGGLHPSLATKYFRVGHMGISVMQRERKYLEKTLNAIKKAIGK